MNSGLILGPNRRWVWSRTDTVLGSFIQFLLSWVLRGLKHETWRGRQATEQKVSFKLTKLRLKYKRQQTKEGGLTWQNRTDEQTKKKRGRPGLIIHKKWWLTEHRWAGKTVENTSTKYTGSSVRRQRNQDKNRKYHNKVVVVVLPVFVLIEWVLRWADEEFQLVLVC